MPTLLKYRNYDEKDVLNYYAVSGQSTLNKGTLVTVQGSGLVITNDPVEMLGAPGASFDNTVSQRYGVKPKVTLANTGDQVIGMTLFDIRETDENDIPLRFDKAKQHRMEAILSGQAMPIVKRGQFLYSGITGSVSANDKLYVDDNGVINNIQKNGAQQVGVALGAKDPRGHVMIDLDIR